MLSPRLLSPRHNLILLAVVSLAISSPTSWRQASAAKPQVVEFFEAVRYQHVKPTVIAKGHSRMVVVLENTTAKPIAIQPVVVAAVPTARVQPMADGTTTLAPSSTKTPQSLATVICEQYAVNGIRPIKTPSTAEPLQLKARGKRRFELPCFCLEYGNPDPTPKVPYQFRPLKDVGVTTPTSELLTSYLDGIISQRPLQLAIWHLQSRTPWNELGRLNTRHGRRNQRYSAAELKQAMQLVENIKR